MQQIVAARSPLVCFDGRSDAQFVSACIAEQTGSGLDTANAPSVNKLQSLNKRPSRNS